MYLSVCENRSLWINTHTYNLNFQYIYIHTHIYIVYSTLLPPTPSKVCITILHTLEGVGGRRVERVEWSFMGKKGARFKVAHELPCITRKEGGSADVKNGG